MYIYFYFIIKTNQLEINLKYSAHTFNTDRVSLEQTLKSKYWKILVFLSLSAI